jgi:hypothetical protein
MDPRQIDVYTAMNIVDSYTSASPSEEQLKLLDECYNRYKDLIDAAVKAAKSLRQSPAGAAKLAALEKYLKVEDSPINGEGLALELVGSPEFAPVIAAAQSLGPKAIGLGLSYHYSFLKLGGREQGIEGIIIFPQTVGSTTVPTQFATRKWDYNTKQFKVDLGVSVSLDLSLWFATPVSSTLVAGLLGEIALLLGLNITVVGFVPSGTNLALANAPEGLPLPSLINIVSVGLDLGLELGIATITGKQEVSIQAALSTLSVVNTATHTPVMKIGQPADLKVGLSYPYQGKAPVITLQNNSTTTTTLDIGMPSFLSDSLETATIETPSGWKKTGVSKDTYTFTYTGPDNQAWDTDLEFTISGVVSNTGISKDQKGFVTAKMTGTSSTRKVNLPVIPSPAVLELTPLIFNASIDWSVVVDTSSGFSIQGEQSGTADVQTPPSAVLPLPPGATPTVITDPQGDKWNVEYKFLIQDNKPYMLAAWQKVDSLPIPNKTYFASGSYPLSSSPTEISINYKNIKSTTNLLTITATLKPS